LFDVTGSPQSRFFEPVNSTLQSSTSVFDILGIDDDERAHTTMVR